MLKRTAYVAYERDAVAAMGSSLQDDNNRNRRLAASRIVYHDDGDLFADEDLSNFDGLGHYRQQQTGGNFPGSNVRTSFTNFNPSPMSASSPWLLNTFSFDWESEGGTTIYRFYCWDATTGALLRKRVHQANSSGEGTSDVVEVYGYTSGNLTSESWYGGDTQAVNLSGTNFCTMALPATPAYQINHTYAFGARATSQYAGTAFKTLDLAVDASTGLARESRDTAGLTTTYDYDLLSRLLSVDPTDDAMTTYTWRVPVNASTLARVTIARVTAPGATALAESRIDFDGLGRPVKEEKRMPDDSWSTRTTAYNAMGWKTYVSEAGTSFGTEFLNHDPFGRPTVIRPADGASHEISISYQGVRHRSQTTKVATSTTSETPSTTHESYDRHGRLYEVLEPTGVTTRYEYDAGNRLSKVCQGWTPTACGQTRLFTYDNRYPGDSDRHFALDHLGTPRLVTGSGGGGGFYTLPPCRLLDTRNQSAPLSAGETRTVPMAGSCGIPSGSSAVSVNITVVDASAQGEMTAFPANASRPTASAISYRSVLARANNAILKLGNGALAFFCNQPSGSAHLIIDVNGYFMEGGATVVAYHAYYPFGEELTSPTQDVESRKFTGHERDFANPTSVADDLDYMHQRFCSPLTGRFLSTDLAEGKPKSPQSWNRYAYALGNPLKYIDPDGMAAACPKEGCPDWLTPTTFWQKLKKGLHEASFLPGPSAMAVGPRVAGPLLSRVGQLFSRAFGFGSAVSEGSVLGRSVVTRDTLSHALQANKINHIFGRAEHGLTSLVERFGSQEGVTREVVGALSKLGAIALDSKGLFSAVVKIGDQTVKVEGAIVNGVLKIGTFYVPLTL